MRRPGQSGQASRLGPQQGVAQQAWGQAGPAFEGAAEIGGIVEAEVLGHGFVVVAAHLEQVHGDVGAHLVQFGLEVAAVAGQVALQRPSRP